MRIHKRRGPPGQDANLFPGSSDPSRWWRGLALAAVAIFAGRAGGIDRAGVLAAWYATLLLLGAVVVALQLWRSRSPGPPWLIVAVTLTALALYDHLGLRLHDHLRRELSLRLENAGFGAVALVIAAAVLASPAVVAAVYFVRRLPRPTARTTVMALTLAITGAVGVDALSPKIWKLAGGDSLWYRLTTTTEELLEALGFALLLVALAGLRASQRRESRTAGPAGSPGQADG